MQNIASSSLRSRPSLILPRNDDEIAAELFRLHGADSWAGYYMSKLNSFLHLLLTILCENKPDYARKQKFTKAYKARNTKKTKKCEVMQQ